MEFQVYSVLLEDRYPKGFPEGYTKADLLTDDFPHSLQGIVVEKEKSGCIAFIFGRTEDGRSVCVRVEGVRPKLYYEMAEGDTTQTLRRELEKEIKSKLGDGLKVDLKQFAHDYGYEFDPNTPSKRKIHEYAEVSYPSKTTWQMACKIRRKQMFQKVRRDISDTKTEINRLNNEMLSFRKTMMSGSHDLVDASRYKQMEEQEIHLREVVLVGLHERHESLDDEEFEHGDVDICHSEEDVRFAHEYFVEPVTRFLFEADIKPSSWVSVPTSKIVAIPVTVCDIELQVNINDFKKVERDLDAPYTVLNYDIETLGLDPNVSPVIQISMVFVTAGVRERHLLAIGTVSTIPNVNVHECNNEAQLLQKFRYLLIDKDPDFIVAYNGVNFDNRYLAIRSQKGNASQSEDIDNFWCMSRFAFRPARLRELRLSSSGMGDNLLRYIDMPGRANFDWFVKLKRDLTSEPKYSLNHFAKKFCGLQKEDMDYKEIPILQAGSADDRARLGSYCVVDSDLLEDLNQARTMIIEILQFSSVFGVLPEWVYFRGQQVRFIAQLLKAVRTSEKIPLILNRPPNGFVGEGIASFKGATVNDPKKGFYKEKPVATLDWASLYPSIMRAHNLCHSTHVLDSRFFHEEGVVEYRVNDDFVAYFVTGERHKGILPRILEDLGDRRKAAKKKVKENTKLSKDESQSTEDRTRFAALAKVFDGQQLALKVSMNSIYGACGATGTGKFPDLAISATVTLQGRKAMDIKKEILPQRFPGIDIVYGDTDSVMVTFADAYDVQTCGLRGEEASVFVTDHFASLGYPQMILEFEKCYLPYLLEGKKRYAGLKYEPDGEGTMQLKGIDCKGIETERKDTLPFVKEIMHGCLNILMYKMDEQEALSFFQQKMREFIDGKIEFDKFIMRKNLSAKAEKKPDQLIQAHVNALRRAREPGSEASINEQVEYVIINGHRKEKTTLLSEDPVYAKEHGLKLNLLWYFEHAIREPVKKIFQVFDNIDFVGICKNYSVELDGKRLGVSDAIRNLMGAASSSSSTMETVNAPAKRYVPRPPPPPSRKKAKGK